MTTVRRIARICSTLAAEARREGGRVLPEYGLLLAGVSMVGGVSAVVLGPSISNLVMTLSGILAPTPPTSFGRASAEPPKCATQEAPRM